MIALNSLLNEVLQIIFSLYGETKIAKKAYKKYNKFINVIKQNEYYIYKF